MTRQDIREQLLDTWLEATRAALGEMAGTQVFVQAVNETWRHDGVEQFHAVVSLSSSFLQTLVLSFPLDTATNLAKRILPEAGVAVDDDLVQDCVGEIANVVAGQAKALLGGTLYQFTFSIPTVVVRTDPLQSDDCRIGPIIALNCDQGEFSLGIVLRP